MTKYSTAWMRHDGRANYCKDCGLAVVDQESHTAWHEKLAYQHRAILQSIQNYGSL